MLRKHHPPDSPQPRGRTALASWGRTWRIVALFVALGILAAGQVRNDDDLFPLGSLAQYATAQNLHGAVRSVFMTGDFPAAGETEAAEGKAISLHQRVVGVGRGEIEGQLQRFVDNPELLGVLARAYGSSPFSWCTALLGDPSGFCLGGDGRRVGSGHLLGLGLGVL